MTLASVEAAGRRTYSGIERWFCPTCWRIESAERDARREAMYGVDSPGP